MSVAIAWLVSACAGHSADAFSNTIQPFIEQHCLHCHGPEKQKSNLRFDQLTGTISNQREADLWNDLMGMVVLEEMPPEDEPQPDSALRETVVNWVEAELRRAALAMRSTGGRVIIRRLNKREYTNTIADLLRLPHEVVERATRNFPPDGEALGFDTVGSAHHLTQVHLAKYRESATILTEAALSPPPESSMPFRYEMVPFVEKLKLDRKYLGKVRDQGKEKEIARMTKQIGEKEKLLAEEGPKPYWIRPRFDNLPRFVTPKRVSETFGEEYVDKVMRDEDGEKINRYNDFHITSGLSFPGAISIPHDGFYRIRAFLGSRDAHGQPLVFNMSVDKGREDPHSDEFVRTNQWRPVIDWQVNTPLEKITDEPYEATVYLDRAKYGIWCTEPITFQREIHRWGELRGQVFLHSFSIEGPVQSDFEIGKARNDLFFNGPGKSKDTDYAREILSRFADRAYRRPASPDEIDRLMNIVSAEWELGASFEESIRTAVIYVLSSPSFLFLRETPSDSERKTAYRIDDFALASRLSYLFWSTMPDPQLLDLAAAKKLHKPEILHEQVERLLDDDRSRRFAEEFTRQWLGLGELAVRDPSLEKYPHFDEHLRRSMLGETTAFFQELLRKNSSIDHFVVSDFAMLNERMAVHYGITGVKNDHFRRVPLPPGSVRGGLLGQASVLMATSTDVRTSPVTRGAFIIEKVLGKHLPPPPPNVPDLAEVPEMVDGLPITAAQRMEMHRNNDACRKCHQKIDPLGLAFENFDAVGLWRDDSGLPIFGGGRGPGPAIQATGHFPSTNRSFEGPAEFASQLREHDSNRIARSLTENLFIYAFGRGLEFTDEQAVTDLVKDFQNRGGGLRDLVHAITQHSLFARK